MRGVQAFALGSFHASCPEIRPVDVGGFLWVFCPGCRVIARVETVAPKFATADLAAAAVGPNVKPYVPRLDRANIAIGAEEA